MLNGEVVVKECGGFFIFDEGVCLLFMFDKNEKFYGGG